MYLWLAWTHYVNQLALSYRIMPASTSASWVLKLKVCTNAPC